MTKINKKNVQNKQLQKMKLKINSKTETEKSMLRDLQTLRNKNQISNTASIHGNPVLRFSKGKINSNMSIPENLNNSIRFCEKVNCKTAVNS